MAGVSLLVNGTFASVMNEYEEKMRRINSIKIIALFSSEISHRRRSPTALALKTKTAHRCSGSERGNSSVMRMLVYTAIL